MAERLTDLECAREAGCENSYHARPCPYAPVPIAPDPERDKRVAARRRADAEKAGRALDRLLNRWHFPDGPDDAPHTELSRDFVEEVGDYVLSQLHHNGHYGVPDPWADAWPDGAV